MENFNFKVKKFIDKHHLIPQGSHILAGVSGGPDSLALLHFLKTYQNEYNIQLTVAHVDHMLRGGDSHQELKYVERICDEWGILFEGTRIDVKKEIELRQSSPEVIAREVRYNFFQKVMQKYDIPLLALAHHGDDQIETILMRLTRGTEQEAAAGIRAARPFENGTVIRPFLTVTKDEIEKYNEFHQLKPVYDPTNKMNIYTRNRFRNTILPFLKQENPNVHLHFQRFSEQLIEDEKFLMDLAKDTYTKIVSKNDNGNLSINITDFSGMALPLHGRWKGERFAGTVLPTLEAALDLMTPTTCVMIERKDGDAKTLVDLLHRMKLTDRVIVQAFDWDFIDDCRKLDPKIPTGLLGSNPLDADRIAKAKAIGAEVVGWKEQDLDEAGLKAAQQAGFKVWSWTVNKEERARELIGWGLNGLITNHCDKAREWLA